MSTPQVLILGKDIYSEYVQKLQNITKAKTFDKMTLISNEFKLPVLNRNNQFSVNNPISMFHGIDWLYTPIEIIDSDNETDWKGDIIRIPRDHKSAKALIVSKDSYYKFRDEIIEYESADFEYGVEAFKNICDIVGYTDYNMLTYQKSYNILEAAECKIKCNFNKSSNVNFQHAINHIARYSNAYVYNNNNEMYFKVWEYHSGEVNFSVENDDIKSKCKVDEDINSLYNDYSISYYDDMGTPATDSANNNIGLISRNKHKDKTFVLRGDNNSQIIFKDLTSAVYIGEGKIRRVHKNLLTNPKPLSYIDFELYKDFESRLTINSYFKLTINREGWENNIMEPFKFTISQDKNDITIKAFEVASE
jgi:hypothetical protein